MPRSGTTLVESIVASAKNIISGGELRSIYELFKSRYDEDDSDSKDSKDPGSIYLNRINLLDKIINILSISFLETFIILDLLKKFFQNLKLFTLKEILWIMPSRCSNNFM